MNEKKLLKHLLIYAEDTAKYMSEDLDITEEEVQEAIDSLRTDYVLVPVDDPGLRMVETEITIK